MYGYSPVNSVQSPPDTEGSVVDYDSLPTLSDLPTLSPQSVGSSSVHSSGHVPSSTEHLSDLSVEDILGQSHYTCHQESTSTRPQDAPLCDLAELLGNSQVCSLSIDLGFQNYFR